MVRIAIVDDDCESVKKMEQQITNSVELKQIISVISNYSDGESLRESIDSYDVFF